MRKTMICVIGPSSTGKTTTIRKVYELLGGKLEEKELKKDFLGVLKYDNTVIGCESEGDPPGEDQKEDLEFLMSKEKCDIVIGASRTRGITVNNVQTLSRKYKYEVIWFYLAYVYDRLNNDAYDVLEQKNAEIIVGFVNQIIQGKI